MRPASDVVPEVVAAARQLLKEGKKPTGSRLRTLIGSGTPAKLENIWKSHVDSGGEGDTRLFKLSEDSLHSYAPPSHEEIIQAGEELIRTGIRVTGHTLRSHLNGRGTPSRMKTIWDRYIVILPRAVLQAHLDKIENCLSGTDGIRIQECLETVHRLKSVIRENALVELKTETA